MKKLIATMSICAAFPCFAKGDETHAEYWMREAERTALAAPSVYGVIPSEKSFKGKRVRISRQSQMQIKQMVAQKARAELGSQWVQSAVRIAYVESRFNARAVGPRTRHGRAMGVMQVLPGSARALGYNPQHLLNPEYGIAAGIAHMKACIRSGVRTEREMAACHVAGVRGWKQRLAGRHERYKRQYVSLVQNARVY